jgi:PEP-CTERM motif
MKALMKALLVGIAAIALSAGSATAATIIDFGTGSAGPGGTININGLNNVTGSGIFIDTVTITGAPMNNGVYDVNGPLVCPGGSGSCGMLSFDTALSVITVSGSIPGLGIFFNESLLTGDMSGGTTLLLVNGVVTSVTASGKDGKARDLLANIGLGPNTAFGYFGFTTGVNPTGQGSPYTAISTDITNTTAPEPGSMLLLGSGLTTLALRRRRSK